MSFFSRRRSKSERDRHSLPPISNPSMPQSPPSSYNATMLANGVTGAHHDSRPGSSAMSDASYDFAQHGQGQPQPSNHGAATANNPVANPTNTSHRYANAAPSANSQPHALTHSSRPISSTLPNTTSSGLGNLSRTDQVVLQYFWHAKAEENAQRDLHFLKFPIFGNSPGMRELIPFCEIYSLVKSSQGAKVVGLGTLGSSMGGSGHAGGGTFIGFELFANSQLHIDLDDSWDGISHYRVGFKPFESLVRDPTAEAAMRSWPKPLTIEFLEEQYARWREDLTAVCWDAREVSELGGGGATSAGAGTGGVSGGGVGQQGQLKRDGEDEDGLEEPI